MPSKMDHTALLIIVTLFYITAPVGATELRSSTRAGYEQPCNKTMKCKSDSWFSCDSQTKTCLCLKPEEMTYDDSKAKCVVLIGERCIFALEGESQSSWYETAPCFGTAVCTNGICTCPSGTYEDINMLTCHSQKEFGDNCSQDFECSDKQMLHCFNGTCLCNPLTSIVNPSPRTVELPLPSTPEPTTMDPYDKDSGCYTLGECEEAVLNNRDRRYQPFYGYQMKTTTTRIPIVHEIPAGACLSKVGRFCSYQDQQFCVQNAECRSNVCECNSLCNVTSQGLCGLRYGQTCKSSSYNDNSDDVCSDKFVCSNELDLQTTCSCPNPEYQEYDTTTKTCRSKVWSVCSKEDINPCTRGSSCVNVSGVSRCECDEGLIADEDFKCVKAYGQLCNYDLPATRIFHEEHCDTVSGLVCRNGKCSCPNKFDIYEESRRMCTKPAGKSCMNTDNCVSNSNCTTKILFR